MWGLETWLQIKVLRHFLQVTNFLKIVNRCEILKFFHKCKRHFRDDFFFLFGGPILYIHNVWDLPFYLELRFSIFFSSLLKHFSCSDSKKKQFFHGISLFSHHHHEFLFAKVNWYQQGITRFACGQQIQLKSNQINFIELKLQRVNMVINFCYIHTFIPYHTVHKITALQKWNAYVIFMNCKITHAGLCLLRQWVFRLWLKMVDFLMHNCEYSRVQTRHTHRYAHKKRLRVVGKR